MKAITRFANLPSSAVSFHLPPLQSANTKALALMNCPLSVGDFFMNCLHVSKSWGLLHKAQGATSDFFFPFLTIVAVCLFLGIGCKGAVFTGFLSVKTVLSFSSDWIVFDDLSLRSHWYYRITGNFSLSLNETAKYREKREAAISGITCFIPFILIELPVCFPTSTLNKVTRELRVFVWIDQDLRYSIVFAAVWQWIRESENFGRPGPSFGEILGQSFIFLL